jgi:hypothetical protein
MRYIVIGGANSIGSNLAETLARDHDVAIINNLITGFRENIEHPLTGWRSFEGSITDLDLLMEIFPKRGRHLPPSGHTVSASAGEEPSRLERGKRDQHAPQSRRNDFVTSPLLTA